MTPARPPNTLRIIGGRWRSRRIRFPEVAGLRPTADRVRETLFNWLQNEVPGACCLDLYAGSGACGLEALSRGAAKVVFVERDTRAANAIRAALSTLESPDGQVVEADVRQWLAMGTLTPASVDIAFIDPPYADALQAATAQALATSKVLRAGSRIYLESAVPLEAAAMPDTWRELRHKKAGQVHYYLYEAQP